MITPSNIFKTPKELQKATEYSIRGVWVALSGEKAFRTEILAFLICSVIAIGLGCFSLITLCELALMIYSVFMILIGELINTAIEITVNRISPDYNEISGRAKDVGSAIVFAGAWGAGIVWAIILLGVGLRFLDVLC